MCRHLSVTENMFLGREKVKDMVLSNKEMEEEARKILDELKIDMDPHQVVGDLPVSKQQMVEIAKALSTHCLLYTSYRVCGGDVQRTERDCRLWKRGGHHGDF